MAAGYLFSEGLIRVKEDINMIRLENERIHINLKGDKKDLPIIQHKIITSGCGKSIIYTELTGSGLKKVRANIQVDHELIYQLVADLYNASELFKETGGVHNALLADINGDLQVFREDIGRHNTVDKIIVQPQPI